MNEPRNPSSDEEIMRLAAYLARQVFESPAGCNPNDVQRIAYRGCTVGSAGKERDYGGSCETSLRGILFTALRNYQT